MQVHYSFAEAAPYLKAGTALTWGNFDGVHLGHQALLRALVQKSKELALPSVLLTFSPRPVDYFKGASASAPITDMQDKLHLLEMCGLEHVIVIPFDAGVACLSPNEFLQQMLLGGANAHYILLGYDSAFGKGRQGSYDFLYAQQSAHNFRVEQVQPCLLQGEPASSTTVRRLLAEGRVEAVAKELGRVHSVHGPVRHGFKRGGAVLGFPTANLAPGSLALPPHGVYACVATGAGFVSAAAVNLGVNPSFGGTTPSLEAHLLDFSGDIYGAQIRLYFEKFLRPEQSFASPEALKEQIGKDVMQARDIADSAINHANFQVLHPL